MATADVDAYLSRLEEPKRGTLQTLRSTILEIVPEAEQIISYGVPAFRVKGRTVAGFAAFRDHLSYLPFSGSALSQLADELEGYTMTKSAFTSRSTNRFQRHSSGSSSPSGSPKTGDVREVNFV